MEQFKINNATVRIHNEVNQVRLESATSDFLKKVVRIRKKVRSEAQKEANSTAKKADAEVEAER